MTGSGYEGHYFWDTEIYVTPFLTYTQPEVARNALHFRSRDAARRPRAGPRDGAERRAVPVAHDQRRGGVGVLRGRHGPGAHRRRHRLRPGASTSRPPATRASWSARASTSSSRPRGCGPTSASGAATATTSFHIHGVTGPDEYTTVVNNNLFTNVMARFNLEQAVGRGRADPRRPPAGLRPRRAPGSASPTRRSRSGAPAPTGMTIPFDEGLGIHPQDDFFLDREVWDLSKTPAELRPLLLHYHPLVIYRFQVLKQADVVLALFLQGDRFTAEEKRADFEYYDPITTGDSTLSAVVQSVIAAEVGYHEAALRLLPPGALRRPDEPARQHRRRPAHRLDRWRVERAGLRLRRHARPRRPALLRPAAARRLAVAALPLTWRGSRVRVEITADADRVHGPEPAARSRASAEPCAARRTSSTARRRWWSSSTARASRSTAARRPPGHRRHPRRRQPRSPPASPSRSSAGGVRQTPASRRRRPGHDGPPGAAASEHDRRPLDPR